MEYRKAGAGDFRGNRENQQARPCLIDMVIVDRRANSSHVAPS